MDVSATEKERLAGQYGVEDANKEALKVTNAAVKTLADTIGPSEEAWSAYAERHPILTDKKSQFLLAMAIPAMPKGGRGLTAAQKVTKAAELSGGAELAVKRIMMLKGGEHALAKIRVEVPSGGENIGYFLNARISPSRKHVHIDDFFPEDQELIGQTGKFVHLEKSSNQIGVRQLREVTQQLQERLPFITDNWTVGATRIGGRKGQLMSVDDSRFEYPVGRLAGKKNRVDMPSKRDLEELEDDIQYGINKIERLEYDLNHRGYNTKSAEKEAQRSIDQTKKEIEKLREQLQDKTVQFSKADETRPSFQDWYREVNPELQEAGVLTHPYVGKGQFSGHPPGMNNEQIFNVNTVKNFLYRYKSRIPDEDKIKFTHFLDEYERGAYNGEAFNQLMDKYDLWSDLL